MTTSSSAAPDATAPLAALALASTAWALLASPAAAQTCYIRPLPRVGDTWHCTSSCGRTTPHAGVDFPTPSGTPIPSIADGTAVHVPYSTCLGTVLVIAHPDGMYSGYAHLSAIHVANGASVTRGQTIASSGNSGDCTTGPHLHLTLGDHLSSYYDRANVDPLAYIDSHTGGGTETCNGRDDDCDGRVDEGDLCELALLHDQPVAYAEPTTTDVDADGRVDLCARGGNGVRCWTSTGTGWDPSWEPIPWSDALGWNDVSNYATLRMGDLNADGRADVCARSNDDYLCALSTGTGFGAPTVWRAGMSDANGWSLPQYYTTIRLADVDADGRDDLCARDSEGFGCWLSSGTAFDERVEGPRWSDSAGFVSPKYYGTLRMGDVDGDRRADVCIRGTVGMQCVLSDGAGFPTSVVGPEWSDAAGWGVLQYWSTIRLADVDGDGKDDLCARSSSDLRCVLSTGTGFGETRIVGALSDANGWADRTNYATLRVGDVDGDGVEDLCARGDAEMGCWRWDGAAFVQHAGPAWSDASGWSATGAYYDTIRLADFDGDGRDDLCARAGAGWRCHPSTGLAFGDAVVLDELTDPGNWNQHPYWSTIVSGGRACRAEPESCNERDDDCDGAIDELGVCDVADAGGPITRSDAATSMRDGGPSRGPLGSGCGCRTAGRSSGSGAAIAAIGVALVLVRRRRRALP